MIERRMDGALTWRKKGRSQRKMLHPVDLAGRSSVICNSLLNKYDAAVFQERHCPLELKLRGRQLHSANAAFRHQLKLPFLRSCFSMQWDALRRIARRGRSEIVQAQRVPGITGEEWSSGGSSIRLC